MNDLLTEINTINDNISLLEKDVLCLANAYIQQTTNFELPVSDEELVLTVDYKTLFDIVRREITKIQKSSIIDDNILSGYIDYYFQFFE